MEDLKSSIAITKDRNEAEKEKTEAKPANLKLIIIAAIIAVFVIGFLAFSGGKEDKPTGKKGKKKERK